jgi:hypothetical protein
VFFERGCGADLVRNCGQGFLAPITHPAPIAHQYLSDNSRLDVSSAYIHGSVLSDVPSASPGIIHGQNTDTAFPVLSDDTPTALYIILKY